MPAGIAKEETAEEVAEACRALRAAHKTGLQILEKYGESAQYGKNELAGEAKRLGINEDLVRKIRQFANPKIGYTPGELDRLVKLCEKNRRALGITTVCKLVTVAKADGQREAFEEEVIVNRWTLKRVENELFQRLGRRRKGGRRRAVSDTELGLLSQIDGLCDSWERWYAQVKSETENAESQAKPLDCLTQAVKNKLEAATEAVEELRKTAERAAREARKAGEADKKRPASKRGSKRG